MPSDSSNLRARAVMLGVLSGTCWGSMAVSAQYLMKDMQFNPTDLTSLRLLGSGLLLLLLDATLFRNNILSVWKSRRDAIDSVIYGLTLWLIQLTFFVAIGISNAATAAIMVMTGPFFVMSLDTLFYKRRIIPTEIILALCALTGIALIITKGDFSSLDFASLGSLWGLASAFFGAVGSIQPKRLLSNFPTTTVLGWGMTIAGIIACVINPPVQSSAVWNLPVAANYAYIVVVGTVLAFWFYLHGVQLDAPKTAIASGAFEPLSAIVFAVLLLGVRMNWAEILGALIVFTTSAVLSRLKN